MLLGQGTGRLSDLRGERTEIGADRIIQAADRVAIVRTGPQARAGLVAFVLSLLVRVAVFAFDAAWPLGECEVIERLSRESAAPYHNAGGK